MRTNYEQYIEEKERPKKAYFISNWPFPAKRKRLLSLSSDYGLCAECDEEISIGDHFVFYEASLTDLKGIDLKSGVFAMDYLDTEDRMGKKTFRRFELCLDCNQKWIKAVDILRKNNFSGVIIVFGMLIEVINFLFDRGCLSKLEIQKNGWLNICPEAAALNLEEENLIERNVSFFQMQAHSAPML